MVITGSRTTLLIILSWIVAGICALPPVFGTWARFTFSAQTGGGCMPAWSEELGYSIFWVSVKTIVVDKINYLYNVKQLQSA